MNPPREDQSAGQETVHAETTGGPAPPIRTETGLPADRAKLRDRGEYGSQVIETCGSLPAVGYVSKFMRDDHLSGAVARTRDGYIKDLRQLDLSDPKNLEEFSRAIDAEVKRQREILKDTV